MSGLRVAVPFLAVQPQARMYRVWVPIADVSSDLGRLARWPAGDEGLHLTAAQDDDGEDGYEEGEAP